MKTEAGLIEFGQHVAHGLGAHDTWFMTMRRSGRDVDHVARPGLDDMIIETIADTAGKDENRVSGQAPISLGCSGRVWRAFLIAERDAEAGHGLSDFQPVAGLSQRVIGGGEQIRAGCHVWQFARA